MPVIPDSRVGIQYAGIVSARRAAGAVDGIECRARGKLCRPWRDVSLAHEELSDP